MLAPNEAGALIEFLDRTPITGHQERNVMNLLVQKLQLMKEPPTSTTDVNPDQSIVKSEETSDD